MSKLTDEIKEKFAGVAICAEPVYRLADCIAAADKRKAAADADAEDFVNPISDIAERFRAYIYLCNEQELEFLRYAAELSEKRGAWEDKTSYYPSRAFLHGDLLYLFAWEDNCYLVLPDELAAIYHEATQSEGFSAANALKLELSMYAAAMLNMYGAYEIEYFVDVWNHHHKDKITQEEAEKFLSDRAYFHSDFYFIDGFVVHDCLFYDDFEELLEATEDMDYYMPTKSVIREYAARSDVDSKIPGETEMDAFLARHVKNEVTLDDLQLDVSYSCHRLENPAVILQDLADAGAPIDDEQFRGEFERLYNIMRDQSRIWELRGLTPYQYQAETGETVERFKLPKVKKRRKK